MLSRIARELAAKKINIESADLASLPSAKKGRLVMRVSDAKKALRARKFLPSE